MISLRPEDVRDHGEELVGAARIMARDEPYGYVEPLLSTEYDENGIHTRATLELWTDGDGPPSAAAAGGSPAARSRRPRAASRPPGSRGASAARRPSAATRSSPPDPRSRAGPIPGESPAVPIRAFIFDFGGVLTSPLMGAFANFQADTGVTMEQLGTAMAAGTEQLDGANPLFELECGRITEDRFLDILRDGLEPIMGERPPLHRFKETYFDGLHPNEEMIDLARELSADHRMAILTNNVREWEPIWRAKLPVDEIFETVVDSAFVGMRKPDHADLRADARAARRDRRRGVPVHRRHRGQLRRGAGARDQRGALPRQRPGDRGSKVGAR